MKDVYDLDSGLFYCALTSRPKEAPAKKHSTIAEGLLISVSFIAGTLFMFAIA